MRLLRTYIKNIPFEEKLGVFVQNVGGMENGYAPIWMPHIEPYLLSTTMLETQANRTDMSAVLLIVILGVQHLLMGISLACVHHLNLHTLILHLQCIKEVGVYPSGQHHHQVHVQNYLFLIPSMHLFMVTEIP